MRRMLDSKAMTVAELARLSGVRRTTISSWMSGARDLKVTQLERMLLAMGQLDRVARCIHNGR